MARSVPCSLLGVQDAEVWGCSSTIHSWTNQEAPEQRCLTARLGNPAAFRNRKEVLCAVIFKGYLQGNTCVVVITHLTPEILLEKPKETLLKNNHESQTQKRLLGNSLRRMLVRGSVWAGHWCALLWISNYFTLEFDSSRPQRKTVC